MVCILNEADAQCFTYAGIAHKCSSRRHHHISRNEVQELVRTGEMMWLGKHKKMATFRNARSWAKVTPSSLENQGRVRVEDLLAEA